MAEAAKIIFPDGYALTADIITPDPVKMLFIKRDEFKIVLTVQR
jgi:hypothetical protein